MKYFKNQSNQIFAFEAVGSQDHLIKQGMVEITEQEMRELTAPPPLTPDELRKHYTQVIQDHMDTKAQERNYDGILSLCTYATSSIARFAAEGQAGVEWRDAVWAKGYELLDKVLAGEIDIPSEEELIGLLPELTWPTVE